MLKEFREFIARGNVVDLAVGLIMGAAFGAITTSLVNDIVMPPIGMVLGGVNFKDLFLALNGQSYPSLDVAKAAGAPVIAWGAFINVIINFIVIAIVMFFLVKAVNRIYKKEAPPAAPTEDVKLLTEIRDLLKSGAQAPIKK
jgi:large conductance mechanosensitive channel